MEGREGDVKKKFQKEGTNHVRSSERLYCVYRVVRMYLWGKHKVYGGEGKGMAYDKNGEMHMKQAGH